MARAATALRVRAATMRAAVVTAPGAIRVEEHAAPEPGRDDVLVRVEGCGVCGSNVPVWEGKPWFTYPLAPGALGHEAWGTVEALGDQVTGLALGDRVAILSERAFAELDVAPAAHVVRLPPSFDGKPFPGEAVGCAMNIFARIAIAAGQTVAIIGIGFLGALLTRLCTEAGARVVAVSRRPYALQAARAAGAAETIALADHDTIVAAVRDLTDGRG